MKSVLKGMMKVATAIILIVASKKTFDSARGNFNNANKSLGTNNLVNKFNSNN